MKITIEIKALTATLEDAVTAHLGNRFTKSYLEDTIKWIISHNERCCPDDIVVQITRTER